MPSAEGACSPAGFHWLLNETAVLQDVTGHLLKGRAVLQDLTVCLSKGSAVPKYVTGHLLRRLQSRRICLAAMESAILSDVTVCLLKERAIP